MNKNHLKFLLGMLGTNKSRWPLRYIKIMIMNSQCLNKSIKESWIDELSCFSGRSIHKCYSFRWLINYTFLLEYYKNCLKSITSLLQNILNFCNSDISSIFWLFFYFSFQTCELSVLHRGISFFIKLYIKGVGI